MSKIIELSEKIKKAKQEYYNGTSSVTDQVYDSWLDELKRLDPNHDEVISVGSLPVSSWAKHKHTVPMGSLNKVNTFDEFKAWSDKFCSEFFLTHKLDGLSLCLIYENGKLAKAVTRGSGEVGEDIFQNAMKIPNIPKSISLTDTVYVRGELLFKLSFFSRYKDIYSNPRNAASGISRRYDGSNCEDLSFFAYEITCQEIFNTEKEQFVLLENIGFDVPDYQVFKTASEIEQFRKNINRSELPYEIDGLVIRENNIEKQKSFGIVNSRPKGAIAYKFDAAGYETKITSIDFQVGSSGIITPVAYFEPIDIDGVTVKKCSLYNMDYVQKLQLDVGSKVLVIRANDVIPRIEQCIESTGTIKAPEHCPECNADVIEQGAYLKCSKPSECLKSKEGKIIKFLSTMNILEWGDKLVHQLFEAKLVDKISDLYFLTEEQLCSLPRMGKKSAKNCLKTLSDSKTISLDKFLGSIGIPGCSDSTIRLLIESGFDSFEKITKITEDQLNNIKGLGEVKSKSIIQFFIDNLEEAQLIHNQLNIVTEDLSQKIFAGKVFCFTGSFSDKKSLEKLVSQHGGVVKSSVTKNTNYLVTNDTSSGSSKNEAAKQLNIPVLTEQEFLNLVK